MSKGRPAEYRPGSVSEDDRESVCKLREAFNLPCNTCKYHNYCQQKGLARGGTNGNCK